MNREHMLDEVVRRFGHENKWTIWFFEIAEVLNDEQLENAYIALTTMQFFLTEEDE